jgi:hypothetical protein
LMAFDNLLEDVCKDATVFFAMILFYLYFNIYDAKHLRLS